MLPNFLVIGVAKSGTTSLWAYLDAHPEIFMSQKKELDFFCDPDWRQRLDWYEQQFERATEPLRGEASVYYSMHPFKADVAPRIRELIPGAKLVYLVRDPVPRAISGYVQNVAVGYERRPINEAFADLDDPANEYIASSRYASQLKEYLRYFPREQIFVADQADLLSDREGTLRQVFEFLGADPAFSSERFDELVNTREGQMGGTKIGYKLRSTQPANAIRRLPEPVGRPIIKVLQRIFWRRIERHPELDPKLQQAFVERIRPEVEELSALTGRSFPSWSI